MVDVAEIRDKIDELLNVGITDLTTLCAEVEAQLVDKHGPLDGSVIITIETEVENKLNN